MINLGCSNLVMLVFAALISLIPNQAAVQPQQATLPAQLATPTGKITFAAAIDSSHYIYEIFSINADGTNKTQLTHEGVQDWAPTWSPDGTKIAYLSNKDGNVYHIYVMHADGTQSTLLSDQPTTSNGVAWSPDGTKLAFTSDQDGNKEIYVMHADGTHAVNLTNNPGEDNYPSWSPDSQHLIFASSRTTNGNTENGNLQLYVMNADGSHLKSLTGDFDTTYAYGRWSPDGTQIAEVEVRSDARDTRNGVDIISLVGAPKIPLPYEGTYDSPSWSPDGKYLVVTHRVYNDDQSIRTELHIVGIDTDLDFPLVLDGQPEVANWSPVP